MTLSERLEFMRRKRRAEKVKINAAKLAARKRKTAIAAILATAEPVKEEKTIRIITYER